MRIRLKLFLIFALIAAVPLLVLSLFSFLTNLHNTRSSLRSALDHEIAVATDVYQASLRAREQELLTLASSRQVIAYVREGRRPAVATNGQSGPGSALGSSLSDYWVDALSLLLRTQRSYSAIACFDPGKRLLFVAEPAFGSAAGSVVFRTGDLVQNQHQPDARIWNAKGREAVCGIITVASAGKTLRCATPVYTADETSTAPGALVTDLKIDSLLTDVTRRAELTGAVESNGYGPSGVVVVLDRSGEIVYHTNDALKHQQVNSSMPDFAPVSLPMMSGEAGSKIYRAAGGDEWLAVYAPLQPHGLSLAIARNVSLAAGGTRRAGWLGLALALLLGVGVAMVLTLLYQRQTQSIERVTEGVAAIAKGELDLHIEARSTDDMRPLADSVNLMTERLREQIAREAETRQFQSFVRLSAMLTHDLKNAIGSLSLLVGNMEQHFDNEEFRADAMKSLTGATEKLKRLVERISNPITTLSGEFKRPEPIDLVPLVRRVMSETIEPLRGTHQIETNLPTSLLVLVDGERIEKVIENLALNALEAMAGKTGKLTVTAGQAKSGDENDRVYLTVTDTGVGMSSRFIEDRLFHAFATTKKHGMGLGLYTCREVVRANGGTIEVESRQGAGTTFKVVLPSPPTTSPSKNP